MLVDLFPSESSLDDMLKDIPANPIHPALVIVDPLIPPQSLWDDHDSSASLISYDTDGYSEYTRVVAALLEVVSEDRYIARSNIWLLRHFLALQSGVIDLLMFPSEPSHFFAKDIPATLLERMNEKIETLTAFLLPDVGEGAWHKDLTTSVLHLTPTSQSDPVSLCVHMLLTKAHDHDSVQNARSLYTTMRHVLSDAVREDAEQWMLLARKIEKRSTSLILFLRYSGLCFSFLQLL